MITSTGCPSHPELRVLLQVLIFLTIIFLSSIILLLSSAQNQSLSSQFGQKYLHFFVSQMQDKVIYGDLFPHFLRQIFPRTLSPTRSCNSLLRRIRRSSTIPWTVHKSEAIVFPKVAWQRAKSMNCRYLYYCLWMASIPYTDKLFHGTISVAFLSFSTKWGLIQMIPGSLLSGNFLPR